METERGVEADRLETNIWVKEEMKRRRERELERWSDREKEIQGDRETLKCRDREMEKQTV
jgi:hypothetical protein